MVCDVLTIRSPPLKVFNYFTQGHLQAWPSSRYTLLFPSCTCDYGVTNGPKMITHNHREMVHPTTPRQMMAWRVASEHEA